MLGQLKAAHHAVLTGVDALAAIVAADSPDAAALAQARWRLIRASRNKAVLLAGAIYPAIERGALAAADVAAMRANDRAAAAASSRHIAEWTPEKILSNWSGYQQASAVLRASIIERVERERATLYPLLHKIDRD